MNNKVVVIGAGGTGRGFLARLLYADGAEICFVDKEKKIIDTLNSAGTYRIFRENQEDQVTHYRAYTIDDQMSKTAAKDADWIFVSVGNEHLHELAGFFDEVAKEKGETLLKIVVCENGIAPKVVMRNALKGTAAQNALVTQAVIFCTSIPDKRNYLNILSEDYNILPYDTDEDLFELPFEHCVSTQNFSQLLERKIYTYNCLSACIGYFGAYKGYEDYADAGNDAEIRTLCEELLLGLNKSICSQYHVTEQEQKSFSDKALAKFSNHDISDTVQKNVRAVIRKLSPTERVMAPIRIMQHYKQDPTVLFMIAAACLLYLDENEPLLLSGKEYTSSIQLFKELNPDLDECTLEKICTCYKKMKEGTNLFIIYQYMQKCPV